MDQNDRYAPFRPVLTAQQRERIEASEKPAKEYGSIAVEEAKKQLALLKNAEGKTVVLPDEPDICLRFPGVDPRGVYSAVDMRFKSRMQRLDAVLNLREERFRRQLQDILSSEAVRERWEAVKPVHKPRYALAALLSPLFLLSAILCLPLWAGAEYICHKKHSIIIK